MSFFVKDWRRWAENSRGDIAEVLMRTRRDDTGIYYDVVVSLRSLAAHAYEEGEDHCAVWSLRVEFGQTDATVAGGSAFVQVAREQARIADTIAAIVFHGTSAEAVS